MHVSDRGLSGGCDDLLLLQGGFLWVLTMEGELEWQLLYEGPGERRVFLLPLYVVSACEGLRSICSRCTYLENQTHKSLACDAYRPIRLLLAFPPFQEVGIQRARPGRSEG